MRLDAAYRLEDGVQVRRENFGLLFYDYRGPRLYFLPSENLIRDDFFQGRQVAGDLVESFHVENGLPRETIRARLSLIMEMLLSKGLVHEQPIC